MTNDGKHRGSLYVRALKPPYPLDCFIFNREDGTSIVMSRKDGERMRAVTRPDGGRTMHVIVIEDEDLKR
jgi:hypothetical protein